MYRRFLQAPVLLLAMTPTFCVGDEKPDVTAATRFEEHIRPVLASQCLKCHGQNKQEGNLRLDSLSAMLEGGESGPAIVSGDPAESLLIQALKYESFEMPPTGPLSEQEIQRFESWVSQHAPWPDHQQRIREVAESITDQDRDWWAFRPLEEPAVPQVDGDHWSHNEIDRFVYQELAEQGMRPASPAHKITLVRRLYFDLIGLPPSPTQIDKFVNDTSPDAWEKLVDRLLADTAYGEHWARHWLDVVRYAESDGWNQDAYRPHIWRYRDYVIKSFNDDKPYPEFVRQQLAGDEIPGDDPENLAATGFLRLGIYEYNQRDARSHWNDIMNEITDVAGDVFLGMGMACARCHDHKFDPLLQTDYFRLRAFFEPVIWRDDIHYATNEQLAAHACQLAKWEAATGEIRAEIDALLKPYHDRKWKTTVDKFPLDIQACFQRPVEQRTSWEHQMAYLVQRQFEEEGGGPLANIKKSDKQKYEALQQKLAQLDHLKPEPLSPVMAAADFPGAISPTIIPDDPEAKPVDPGIIEVLAKFAGGTESAFSTMPNSSGRRTWLARWIGRPDNPLTTRVIVNRIWQQHFGKGIVATANDFGHLGQPPTHPELLDWLTCAFIQDGWSFKRLHKRILMSAAWQQSADHPLAAEYQQKDPDENLLWRANIRRLTAEQIRDAMLAVSGELRQGVGGPSVDANSPRRSVYLKSFRNTPHEFLHTFDSANGLKSTASRNTTTTPTQSLMMTNGAYALGRAAQLASRVWQLPLESADQRLAYAFRLTWGRAPSPAELSESLRFACDSAERYPPRLNREKLIDFCHVLLNSNEFLYVD